MLRCSFLILIFLLGNLVCGCASHGLFAKKIVTKPNYETCAAMTSDDMELVSYLNKQAVEQMTSVAPNYPKAETLLKKALSIDPNCGKAHYNLGIVYANQCNYYLAALEFEKAYNLLKDEASRNNLNVLRTKVNLCEIGKMDNHACHLT